ncbi:MAG: hypothetical protein ACJ762_10385 [Solirubrobacteraceae bacterium]
MHGAVYLTIVAFVVLLVLSIFMTPLALVPAAILLLFFLMSGPLMAAIKGTGGNRQGSGTPSTPEASYDPVSTPGQRPA